MGSGKWPFLPAHSISKLSMRNGAIFENSPSGVWLIKSVQLTAIVKGKIISTKLNLWKSNGLYNNSRLIFLAWGYRQSNSSWQYERFLPVFLYFPQGTSIQLPPTILQSIMNRRAKSTLLSYVIKLFMPKPSIWIPLSRIPVKFSS